MNKEHISLRLDGALVKKIDALARDSRRDRSEMIAELLSRAVSAPEPAPGPGPGDAPPLPAVLQTSLEGIEKWRLECAAEAAKRSRNYWLLTLPPIVINAGYGCGLFGKLGLADVQSLALFLSTLLMLIEKERPQNRLFTAYERAALDLGELARAMVEQWQAGCAAGQDQRKLTAQILGTEEKEEARLSKFIEDAESYLKDASISRRSLSTVKKAFAEFRPA